MSLVIKNGTLSGEKKDILIVDGKIKEIGSQLVSDNEIDASGLLILPGAVDCHVHLREPGHDYKEDFLSGSKAAAKGGVTSFLVMPNTDPPIDTVEHLSQERKLAAKSVVNYGLYMVGMDNVPEIQKAKNIAGVKIYLDVTTGNLNVEENLDALFSSFKRIAVHAEGKHVDESILRIKKTKNRLYLCHISTRDEIDFIRENKNKQIFCEVSPHHLFLTSEDEETLKGYGMMKPSLKTKEDQDSLWKGIADRTVDTIGTDHAPHAKKEKESNSPPWGVPGLETMMPLLLDAVNKGRLPLQRLVELVAENPCKIFDIPNKGKIKEGYDADIMLVDMGLEKKVKNSDMMTKCGWSPFDGKLLKGWPVMTIVNGHLVYDGTIHDMKGKEIEFR